MTAIPAAMRRPVKNEGWAARALSFHSRVLRLLLWRVNRSSRPRSTDLRPNRVLVIIGNSEMITATRTMAVELAPAGIRVNAINPVAGDTPLLKTFMGEDTPEIRAKFLATIPIGRFSTPEDMGNAACYLCSDEAGMVTGVAMEVDGGRCI